MSNQWTLKSGVCAAAVVGSVWAGKAGAAVIATDSFESPTYAAGSQVYSGAATSGQQAGTNGGTGYSGHLIDAAVKSAVTVQTSPLSYSGGAISVAGGSQALQIGAGNGDNVFSRAFAGQSSGPVYFSLLMRQQGSTQNEEDFLQLGLSNAASGSPLVAIGTAGTSSDTTPNKFYARATAGGASAFGTPQVTATADETFFLVGKVSKTGASGTYNQIELFINPTTLTEPGTANMTAAVGADATGTVGTLSNLILRRARSDAADTILLDNVTIGTTYADVVPEPGAAGLLASAAGLLLGGRRRRLMPGASSASR